MQKVTVQSPANIAFIKYWGQTKHNLFIPRNNSISMTLSGCITTTTVEKSPDFKEDRIEIQTADGTFSILSKDTEKNKKAYEQIKRIRNMANTNEKVLVKTRNSFPSDAGIASSASGFSALTGALLLVFDLHDLFNNKETFSREVRLSGSASAARSVYGGFVELLAGNNHEEAFAKQIADQNHWDVVDIIAVVDTGKKDHSSSTGHAAADSSPYFETRLQEMLPRIDQTRQAIVDKNVEILGRCMEEDTISMHAVMMTSKPALYYWEPGTISIIKQILEIRKKDNIPAYFTIDAGANVHIITEKKDASTIKKRLQQSDFVKQTIYNEPCEGTMIVSSPNPKGPLRGSIGDPVIISRFPLSPKRDSPHGGSAQE